MAVAPGGLAQRKTPSVAGGRGEKTISTDKTRQKTTRVGFPREFAHAKKPYYGRRRTKSGETLEKVWKNHRKRPVFQEVFSASGMVYQGKMTNERVLMLKQEMAVEAATLGDRAQSKNASVRPSNHTPCSPFKPLRTNLIQIDTSYAACAVIAICYLPIT
jgi:hypothetical protein